jgi:hypothetical protein
MHRRELIFLFVTSLLVLPLAPLVSRAANPSEGSLKPPANLQPGAHADLGYDGAPIASAYLGGNSTICNQACPSSEGPLGRATHSSR